MRKIVFYFIVSFLIISLSFALFSCKNAISIEGVELHKVERETRDIREEQLNIEYTPEGALPIGSFIILGQYQVEDEDPNPILWQVVENKSHYTGNTEPVAEHMTLLSYYIIDQRGFDAKEPDNEEWEFRVKYGNNRYVYSNIRQWLNSPGEKDSWWESMHDVDGPPTDEGFVSGNPTGYYDKNGFLNSFSPEELGLILNTTLEVGINANADGGGTETVTDKVFLLSLTEVGLSDKESKNFFEGYPMPVFDSNEARKAYVTEACYENTNCKRKPYAIENSWHWWLRSPYSWGEYDVWIIDNLGKAEHRRAFIDAFGVRPAINIIYEGISFSGSGTIDDPYVLQ